MSFWFSYHQLNGCCRLAISHDNFPRVLHKLIGDGWCNVPVYLNLTKNAWPSDKTIPHTHTHTHHLIQQLTEMTTTTTKILGGEVVPDKSCAIVHSLRFSDKYIPGRVSNANDAQSSTVSPNHNCGQV